MHAFCRRQARRDAFAMIAEWQAKGIEVFLVEQLPGVAVVSPSAEYGPMHMVLTFTVPGKTVMQTAWNRGFLRSAFQACLGAWQRLQYVVPGCRCMLVCVCAYSAGSAHVADGGAFVCPCPPTHKDFARGVKLNMDNSGFATRFILPCLRMQALGLDLGLQSVCLVRTAQ